MSWDWSGVFDVDLGWLPTIVFVAGMIALSIYLAMKERQRKEGLQVLAQRLGLNFSANGFGISTSYAFLDKLDQGSNRYAFNVLSGDYKQHPVKAFDYHYETYSTDSKGRRQTHHHYFSFMLLSCGLECPELKIYPERWYAKIGQALGFDDIDFESVEFSKAFTVKSKDKKFAYDICHTRMMEYLLNHRELCIEIEAQCISLSFSGRLNVEKVERYLNELIEIRELLPKYLFREARLT